MDSKTTITLTLQPITGTVEETLAKIKLVERYVSALQRVDREGVQGRVTMQKQEPGLDVTVTWEES